MAETPQPKGAYDPRLSQPYYPVQVELVQPYNPSANRRRTCLRFVYAFAVAALVWVVGATFWSVAPSFPWRGRYPIPPHVTLENCVSYDEWERVPADQPGLPFAAVTTFDLPLSAESLLLLSRGPQSGGSVEIAISSEQDQDKVTVEVVASYVREDDRNDAKVCQVLSKDGGIGVGIFTRRLRLFNRLRFATKVIFPELSDKSPLLIKKFETDVHNTAHRLGDLSEKILFKSLHLKGSNGRIDVLSVKADEGIIKTSNGGISGDYNATSLLILSTTNAQVRADIGLWSINESEPKLVVGTSNGAVKTGISLVSDKGTGGSFEVTTGTSNSPLDIEFHATPPDSKLELDGKTSNAGMSVSLNSAYEGSFLLETWNFKPQINQDKTVVDPSGRNRTRTLNYNQEGRRVVFGEVFWDDATEQEDSKAAGSVYLRTSNGKIDLNL